VTHYSNSNPTKSLTKVMMMVALSKVAIFDFMANDNLYAERM